MVGWLGATKILMGWPLQVAAFAAMVWLLAVGRTPMESEPEAADGQGTQSGTDETVQAHP